MRSGDHDGDAGHDVRSASYGMEAKLLRPVEHDGRSRHVANAVGSFHPHVVALSAQNAGWRVLVGNPAGDLLAVADRRAAADPAAILIRRAAEERRHHVEGFSLGRRRCEGREYE